MASPIRSGGIRTISTLASPAPVPQVDPNALTPEEIAEFEAKEQAAQVAPAPVAEPVAAAPVATAPAADPNALTPAEIAEFEAKEKAATPAGPQVINPVTDLTADELADFASKDSSFILDHEFKKGLPHRLGAFGKRRLDATLAEVREYNALKEKFAEADHKIRERGFTLEDLPGPAKIGTALKDFVVGVGKYAKPFLASAAGANFDPIQRAENERGILEGAAATEASLTGLAHLAKQTASKASRKIGETEIGRKIGFSKPLSEYTLDEKVKAFDDKMKRGEVQEATLRGEGPVMGTVAQDAVLQTQAAGYPIRPEEVAEKSAGDPFAVVAFGKVMGLFGKIVPAPLRAAAQKVEQKLVEVAPKIVGGGITAAGDLTTGTAKVVEKTAPTVGAVVGGIKGAQIGGIPGALIGAGAGRTGGQAVAKTAKAVRGVSEKVAGLGEQVSGSRPMVSSYAQLVRSAAEAAPGAIRAAGEGFAMDVGLAAVSSESPQDTEGAINVGTALGFLSGIGHTVSRLTSGQIVSPRSYGVNTPVATSAEAHPALRAMHDEAYQAKTPAERANINASRQMAKDYNTDAEFFVGKDAPAVEAALLAAGVEPGRAKTLSEAEGFFTTELPGKPGKDGKPGAPRKVIIARNVAAAPHEALHAIQKVLGEPANRALDELIMRDYADIWDQEGNKYADRFGERAEGQTWEEVVLNKSGWGRAELADKMFRELTASNEAQGNPPNPELIKRLVTAEIARLEAEKGGDPQNIWAGELSAEEAKAVANRYNAREIAAENFDIAIKNLGIGLQEGNSLPQRLARVVAALITALGGDPLKGTASELGGVQPRMATLQAVKEAARGQLPVVEVKAPTAPGEPTVTPKTPAARRPGAPGQSMPVTPEQQEQAAAEAQVIADAAPDVVAPGAPAEAETPRVMLGTVAQAIAQRSGVKINYRSAPEGVPAGDTSSNRNSRRAVIDAWRSMPESAKALWEKNFFPERVVITKGGEYQVQGWAPEVFASNAHKIAKALIDARKGDFSPYALDPQTGSFTPEGWQRLYEDTQKFVENQSSGRTGSGEELVVPRNVIDAGGYKPPVTGEAKTLGQPEADFINMLFNFKIPEGPRMQEGKRPGNIVAQEVSEASIPGRVEPPFRPRGEFAGQEAVAQGIAGKPVMEVNPVRNQIETALGQGNMPSFNDARQNLNLKSINDVTITPEQPQFRGNTLMLTAGLAPAATKSGRKLDERGFSFTRRITDEGTSITITKDGVKVGKIDAEPRGETGAYVSGVQVEPAFRDQGISEILYRELGQELKTQGKTEVTGNIVSPKAVTARAKGFAGTEFSSSEGGFADAAEASRYIEEGGLDVRAKSRITADSQFAPKKLTNSAKDTEFEVVHFSSKFGLKEVSPKFFGKGKATPTDLRGDPKAYFFIKGSEFGQDAPIFKDAGLEEYNGTISGSDLYDLRKGKEDPLNWRGTVNRSEADAAVKKAGYGGIVLDTADGRGVIAMFKATKVSQPKAQRPASKAQFAPSTNPRAVKTAAVQDKDGKIFTGTWHGDAIVKAMTAGSDGDLTDGFVTNDGEFLDRDQAFARAKELEQIPKTMSSVGGLESFEFERSKAAQSNRWKNRPVKDSVDDVLAMSAPEWTKFMGGYRGEFSSSATGIAMDIGKLAKTPEDLLALKVGADIATERYNKARSMGDLETAMAEAMRKQTFSEAIQTAEGTRPALIQLAAKAQLAPKVPDDAKVKKALSTDKIPYIGAHRELAEGTPVGVRIDIPAFTRNGEYVQTVHEAKTGGSVGKRIGYDGIVTLDDPTFFSNEKGAQKILEGAPKFPVATVEGKYNSSRKVPRDLSEWTEVGYNPHKHSYFYEKGTDELVTGGTKAVSVGNSVFVKDAVFGDKSTAQFAPKGYYAEEMWLGKDKLNVAEEGHLKWAEDNFPDKDNASALYRDMDTYERAKAAGYLRVVAVADTLSVDPSPKYPTWQDVPRRFKEALEDYAEDHTLKINFNGRTVRKQPTRGGAGEEAQMAPKGYNANEMWLGRDGLHDADGGHKQWADENFPGGPEDTGDYHEAYERAKSAGYLRVVQVGDTLSVDASRKYPNWADVPRPMKEALEDNAAEHNLRVKFKGAVVMEQNWTGHTPEAQLQAPVDAELKKIRDGEVGGNTFTSDGKVWNPGDEKTDVVSMASTNIPRKDLTREAYDAATKPFEQVLSHPSGAVGIFAFERDGKEMVSIDINALVPQEHRDNTVQFATDNDQISFWDSSEGVEVKTGGAGDTKLKTPEQILAVLDDLVSGKPVEITPSVVVEPRTQYSPMSPDEISVVKRGAQMSNTSNEDEK